MVKLGETTVNRRVGAFRPRLVPYLRLASIAFAISPLSFLTTTGRGASGDWRPARLDCRRSRRGGERSPTARVISPISIASGLRSCTGRSCNAPGRSGPRSVRAAPLDPETSWPSARRRSPGPGGHQPTARVLRPRLGRGQHRRHGPDASGAGGRAVRRRPLAVLGRPAARRRPPDRGQLAGPLARRRRGGVGVPEGRGPAIPDRQLPLIEQALLQGPAAHGFDGEVWSAPQVAEVIERLT